MPSNTSRLAVAATALALVFGAVGCSDDDAASDKRSDGDLSTVGDNGTDPDGGRPFDLDRENLAQAMASAMSADEHHVDGNVIRLVFSDGSVESTSVFVNCNAAQQLKGEDDRVILSFPDGDSECTD